MVSMSTYAGIVGVGGLITGLTGYTLHNILQGRVRDSPVYKEAMKICNSHSAVTTMLGKPVHSRRIDLSNKNNVLSLRMTTLELPVYGPKNDGLLYIWANRQTDQEEWDIVRMDLEILDKMGGTLSIIDKKIVPSPGATDSKLVPNKNTTDSKLVPNKDATDSKLVPNKDATDSKLVPNKDVTDSIVVPSKNVIDRNDVQNKDATDSKLVPNKDVSDSKVVPNKES